LLVYFSFSVKVIKEIGVISFHQRLKPSSKGEYLFSSLLFKAVHKLVVDVKHLRNIV
jgi:putative lipoic acid-binding regulatory protein